MGEGTSTQTCTQTHRNHPCFTAKEPDSGTFDAWRCQSSNLGARPRSWSSSGRASPVSPARSARARGRVEIGANRLEWREALEGPPPGEARSSRRGGGGGVRREALEAPQERVQGLFRNEYEGRRQVRIQRVPGQCRGKRRQPPRYLKNRKGGGQTMWRPGLRDPVFTGPAKPQKVPVCSVSTLATAGRKSLTTAAGILGIKTFPKCAFICAYGS